MPFVRICALLSVMLPALPSAQTPAISDPAESAASAYKKHDWTEAEKLYSSLAKTDPESARFRFRLGVSARANKHYDLALDSFATAKSFGAGKGLPAFVVDYELATTYAAMGNSARALELLAASAERGFQQTSRLNEDVEWRAVRDDPKYVNLAKQVQHNAAPCDDPEFKQFDFWVGNWDVTSSADGVPRGTSHISREMGGCVIWENWTSTGSGYFGKSYNTYNVNLKQWEQYWVDNGAGVMFFHGNLKDGVMDYWTDDVPQTNGQRLRRHLQFLNLSPDKVRQFSQGSTDGGKTWSVEYDLTYKRHAPKTAAVPGS